MASFAELDSVLGVDRSLLVKILYLLTPHACNLGLLALHYDSTAPNPSLNTLSLIKGQKTCQSPVTLISLYFILFVMEVMDIIR